MPGSGSSNMDSPTPTGKPIAAILQPKKGLSSVSQTFTQSPSPKVDTSEIPKVGQMVETIEVRKYLKDQDFEQSLIIPKYDLEKWLARGYVAHYKMGPKPKNHDLDDLVAQECIDPETGVMTTKWVKPQQNGSPGETATKVLTFTEIINKYRALCLLRTLCPPTKSDK